MPGDDPFHLQRFLDAQKSIYPEARAELAAGEKRTHWMWFVFPQIAGLGTSSMAQRYAISDLAEARAYLHHPVLGPRLRECTELVCAVQGYSLHAVFGYPDDLKFHSCITLFARADEGSSTAPTLFERALERFFKGKPDTGTLRLLR